MAGFLSNAMKATCNQIISDSAATWEREIQIYRDADRAFIVNHTGEFNWGYKKQWAISQTYTPVFTGVMARVWWKQPNINDLLIDNTIKENLPETFCRIKLRQDGYNFLSGVRSIIIDGIPTNPDFNSPRPHSLFGEPQYYDIICNKVT